MGSSQSQQQLASFEEGYIKETRTEHPYFGNHTLLIKKDQKETIICKQLTFRSSAEYRQFQNEYENIERKPFSIIYPKLMIKGGSFETCSSLYQANIYFDIVGSNLSQIVKTEGCLSQSKAWFLLNEISKALQILSESHRPHWSISPQTIYQNCHQNYLIYDSFFVFGFDTQSFLMRKMDSHQIISEKIAALLQKGTAVSQLEGSEEDCYCLGFVMLFALTGVHAANLPQHGAERAQAVRMILQEKRGISQEMIDIILELTERDALKRMDNYKLRRFLKEREAEIIHNEEKEYDKARKRGLETKREGINTPSQRMMHPLACQPPLPPPFYNHRIINPNEFYPIPMSPPSNRLSILHQTPTPVLARNQQLPGCRAIYADIHRQFPIPPPQENRQIWQLADYPSDRSSKALTRINSYDLLIPKK